MKRLITALVVLLMISGAVVSTGALRLGKTPSLVVMGDSISNGFGVETNQNYAYLVSNELGAKYQNLSQDGLTSTGLVNKLKQSSFCDQVKDADLVMFTIGGNDLIAAFLNITSTYAGQSFTSVDAAAGYLSALPAAELNAMMAGQGAKDAMSKMLETYKANLDAILAKLKEVNPESQVFILTQYNPLSGVESLKALDNAVDSIFVELNKIMSDSAAASGAYIIDIYTSFKNVGGTYTNIEAGDIHPNKDGHSRIARAVVKYLELNIADQPEWTIPETTTPAPTDPPTSPVETTTESPATEPADKGCAGVGLAAILAGALAGAAFTIIKKH